MKHSPVKQHIIEIASNLFYKNGYNLTGINEIIKEAGIAKATLYNHFKSKDDICLAYLKYKDETFSKSIKKFTLKAPKGEKQILALFDFLELFFKQKGFNGCWCIKTVAEIPSSKEQIQDEIKKQKIEFITLIKDLVKENINTKNKIEVENLAKQIYLLYESALAEAHLHKDKWPIESAYSMCKKILN